jgi:hypothetical protein
MDEGEELRILVDCAIDEIPSQRRHNFGCRCLDCTAVNYGRSKRRANAPATTFLIPDTRSADRDLFRVRRVVPLPGPQTQSHKVQRPLTVGAPMSAREKKAKQNLRRQLWSPLGVFLSGATEAQALRWAQGQAALVNGAVMRVMPERPSANMTSSLPHHRSRSHFHIELQPMRPGERPRRSGHIFWGRPPASGIFFEADER